MSEPTQSAKPIESNDELSDTGIIIVNLGTPAGATAKDVSAYLNEFLMDGYVIRLPWPLRRLLVSLILRSRPEESAKAYRKIWRDREPGSPLLHYGQRLRDAMRAETDVQVELAMRYGKPSIETAMARLKDAGVTRVVLAPLYPQHADSTITTTIKAAQRFLPVGAAMTVLPPFYGEDWFVERFASILTKHLPEQWDHVLFSYHGLPEAHLKIADPGRHCLRRGDCCEVANPAHDVCYRHQVRVSTQKIADAMGLSSDQYSQSFQSRLGRAKWLEPYTDATLVELAKRGVKHLAVACPAFVADNLETLEEIAMAGKQTFLDAGGESLTLLPSLNADRQWANSLVDACLRCVD